MCDLTLSKLFKQFGSQQIDAILAKEWKSNEETSPVKIV